MAMIRNAGEEKWKPFEKCESVKAITKSLNHIHRRKFQERQPVKVVKPPKRNDPCPCGSGKKYKKCCGK